MGRPTSLTPQEKKQVVLLRQEGSSYKDLSKQFGCSHPVINRVLRKANLVKVRSQTQTQTQSTTLLNKQQEASKAPKVLPPSKISPEELESTFDTLLLTHEEW